MASRWKVHGQAIRGVVHDDDWKVSRFDDGLQWEVLEMHDQNHVASSFGSFRTKPALGSTPGVKRKKHVLNGQVEFSMHKHFFTMITDGSGGREEAREVA
jgi:hypothetical protein